MLTLLLVPELVHPERAAAQTTQRELTAAEREEARALFVAGSAAVESGRWADAVSSFERAYVLTGAPSALYNLALALRALGRHREARDAFDRLLREHTIDDPALRAEAEQMRADEAVRVAVLELVGLEDGVEHSVRLDGREIEDRGQRPLEVESDAGTHTLVAEREGHRPFVWEGSLADGARRSVRVLFQPLTTASAGDDTAVHVVIVVAVVAALAPGGAVLAWALHEEAQVQPLYPQQVEP